MQQNHPLPHLSGWHRALWLALLVAASVAFTLGLACAVPFAGLGAAAAMTPAAARRAASHRRGVARQPGRRLCLPLLSHDCRHIRLGRRARHRRHTHHLGRAGTASRGSQHAALPLSRSRALPVPSSSMKARSIWSRQRGSAEPRISRRQSWRTFLPSMPPPSPGFWRCIRFGMAIGLTAKPASPTSCDRMARLTRTNAHQTETPLWLHGRPATQLFYSQRHRLAARRDLRDFAVSARAMLRSNPPGDCFQGPIADSCRTSHQVQDVPQADMVRRPQGRIRSPSHVCDWLTVITHKDETSGQPRTYWND